MSTQTMPTSFVTDGSSHRVAGPERPGLAVRRWVLVASPVLAGLCAVVGAAADPAVGESGRVLWEKYAANPDPLQFKSLFFHYSYAFWILPAILLAGYVRDRAVWLANLGGFLGWLGISTLPGLLMVDFYDSAIGQVAGAETTEAVSDLMGETMWGVYALVFPGMVGAALALPVAAVAVWRAGLVRWWAPLLVVGAMAAFSLSNVTWWGALVTTGFFAAFAVELERGTRRRPPEAVRPA